MKKKKDGIIVLWNSKISTLLRGITSSHHGEQKIKVNAMKKYVKTAFCRIVMLSGHNNILEFNQYMKSDKMSYIIYVHTESLI